MGDEHEQEEEPLLRVRVRVTNVGSVAGRDVAQLYLAFPHHAAEPPLVMRAFAPTAALAPTEGETVEFALRRRDFSIWDDGDASVDAGRWRLVPGQYGLYVGASSRDLRLS